MRITDFLPNNNVPIVFTKQYDQEIHIFGLNLRMIPKQNQYII